MFQTGMKAEMVKDKFKNQQHLERKRESLEQYLQNRTGYESKIYKPKFQGSSSNKRNTLASFENRFFKKSNSSDKDTYIHTQTSEMPRIFFCSLL